MDYYFGLEKVLLARQTSKTKDRALGNQKRALGGGKAGKVDQPWRRRDAWEEEQRRRDLDSLRLSNFALWSI